MALRKKTDAKVTSISAFVTIAFYVAIAAIFWNVGGDALVKEFVITAVAGRKPPPPPPPKRTPPKIKMKKPPRIRPRFKVVQPKFTGAGVRPDFGKAIIPIMDNDADLSQTTRMAKMYDMSSVSKDLASMKTASLDIGAKLGFSLGGMSGGRSVVVGTGKRMRAKITLAKLGEQFYMDQALSFKSIIDYIKEETHITVSQKIKKFKWKETFNSWYKKCKTEAVGTRITEIDEETETIKNIGREISIWTGDKDAYNSKFCKNIKSIWNSYLRKRYPRAVEKLGNSKSTNKNLVPEIRNLYKLAPFEKKELGECTRIIDSYTPSMVNDRTNKKKLRAVYSLLRKSELQHYPFVFGNHINEKRSYSLGLSWQKGQSVAFDGELNRENVDYLKSYVYSGGFIYIDDLAKSTEAFKSGATQSTQKETIFRADHRTARRIISKITYKPLSKEEKAVLDRTYKKLSKKDKKIAGFKLRKNSPNPFQPNTYLPFSVSRTCDITLKIYNRIGTLVRTITRKNILPGTYFDRGGKRQSFMWDSKDDAGQTVESGVYFAQLSTGLFQQTIRIKMDELRMLDPLTHPLFTSYYQFTGTPKCHNTQMARGSEKEREYGTSAFGWTTNGHTAIIYTEWAGILTNVTGTGPKQKRAKDFFINVLAYAIGQPASLIKK